MPYPNTYQDVYGNYYSNTITLAPFTSIILLKLEPILLPVELSHFESKCDSNGVKLNWKIASETTNNYYSIQKSDDGERWIELSKINSQSSESGETNYSYVDLSKSSDIFYYQLVQFDVNGEAKILSQIMVDCKYTENECLLFPNPTNNQFKIVVTPNVNINQIIIYDIYGNRIRKYENIMVENFEITMNNISPGSYIVEIATDKNKYLKKLIKR